MKYHQFFCSSRILEYLRESDIMTKQLPLFNAIFHAKLVAALHKVITKNDRLVLKRVAERYGENAVFQYYLSLLATRVGDIADWLNIILQQSLQISVAHAREKYLVGYIAGDKSKGGISVNQVILNFFEKITELKGTKVSVNSTNKSPDSAFEFSMTTLSKPLVGSLAAIRVWEQIAHFFTQKELRNWQQKLEQDSSNQSIKDLVEVYENRSDQQIDTIVNEVIRETTNEMMQALVSSLRQVKKISRLNLSRSFLNLLEKQDVAALTELQLHIEK